MIDYYRDAPDHWCVLVAHGIWPGSHQRALRKGVVPRQGDIKEAPAVFRLQGKSREQTKRASRGQTCPLNSKTELETETSAELWREGDLLEFTAENQLLISFHEMTFFAASQTCT